MSQRAFHRVDPDLAIRAGCRVRCSLTRRRPAPCRLPRAWATSSKDGWSLQAIPPPPVRVSPRVAPPRPAHQPAERKMRLSDFCNRTTTRAPHGLPDSQVRSRRAFARRHAPAHPQPMASGEPPGEASLDGEPSASALSQPAPARCARVTPMTAVGVMPRGPGGASIERSSRAAPPDCGVVNREPSLRRSL
jgi:hypothetical protein